MRFPILKPSLKSMRVVQAQALPWATNTRLEIFRACGLGLTHHPPAPVLLQNHHRSLEIYILTSYTHNAGGMSSPSTKLRHHRSKLRDWSMDSRELRWPRMCTLGRFYTTISTKLILRFPGKSGNNYAALIFLLVWRDRMHNLWPDYVVFCKHPTNQLICTDTKYIV